MGDNRRRIVGRVIRKIRSSRDSERSGHGARYIPRGPAQPELAELTGRAAGGRTAPDSPTASGGEERRGDHYTGIAAAVVHVADEYCVATDGTPNVSDVRVSPRGIERPFGSDDDAVELSERRSDLFADPVTECIDTRLLADMDEGSDGDALSNDADARCRPAER